MSVKIKFVIFFAFFNQLLLSQINNKQKVFFEQVQKKTEKFNSNKIFSKVQTYFLESKFDSVLVYSSKLLTTQNDFELNEYCYFLRGYSFYKKRIFKEARKEFFNISNTFEFYQNTQMLLGTIALEKKEFNKAILYFRQVEKEGFNEFLGVDKGSVLSNLSLCYLHLKKFDKAESYLVKGIKISEQKKDTSELVVSYINIANFYYEQYKDNLAIPYFEKAYSLAKELKNQKTLAYYTENQKRLVYDQKRLTAKNMAVVEENRKNYQKALVYRKEFEKWKDSLNNQNRIYEVAKKEKEFAVKEKQKEVTFLEAENKIKEAQKKELLYAAIVLLILLLTSVYFYREKVKRNKIIAHQKEDLDALNATKDKLFSIVSHDLRSSVNALKSSNVVLLDNLASKNIDALGNLLKKNSAIVNGAYGLLDNLLHWALSQTKQVYFEIKSTRLFFMVEQMAYNYKPLMLEKNIQFENKVSKKDLVLADQESLKLIIRNLLDNAIKFSNKDGEIKVYSRNEHKGYCDLIVEDTGMGMTNETRLKLLEDTLLLSKKEHEDVIGTGLGLQLCKTMVKKNNGKFSIESELGVGTKMIVSLPKKQDNG
ncbi:histidine kinase [Tenacibaculum sp. E3R01]|uniref:ATP-binding protein n=1 Tax=Tenacibaculum sp. E3R01 TaxID=2267227 RepID=UPI000DE8D4B9|nr:tetratricopeptide repeat-containing sensor histidine kinase [Tenacibaculum sp. E3R01]RBW57225.1 histidine kinase [Tenacibaculum sp. E3R01]